MPKEGEHWSEAVRRLRLRLAVGVFGHRAERHVTERAVCARQGVAWAVIVMQRVREWFNSQCKESAVGYLLCVALSRVMSKRPKPTEVA